MMQKVDRTIAIMAPPERVWRAWVHEMNGWWTRPYYNDHDRVTGLSLEPRLGGLFVEKWGEDGSGFVIGQVVEWLPPLRLAYTWSERGWGGAATLVRIEFKADGQKDTLMTFIQEGFERLPEGAKQRDGYDSGWTELSTRLKSYVEKGNPS